MTNCPCTKIRGNFWCLVVRVRDIAAGLKYLSQQNIVHADLSARNLLYTRSDDKRYCIKVGEYYKSESSTLPVRWSAPEVLKFRKFSTASDVWSFGIIIW